MAHLIWTDADVDAMSWHDNAVYAVALEQVQDHPGRLLLDIDYIVGDPSGTPGDHAQFLDLPGHPGLRPGVGPHDTR